MNTDEHRWMMRSLHLCSSVFICGSIQALLPGEAGQRAQLGAGVSIVGRALQAGDERLVGAVQLPGLAVGAREAEVEGGVLRAEADARPQVQDLLLLGGQPREPGPLLLRRGPAPG